MTTEPELDNIDNVDIPASAVNAVALPTTLIAGVGVGLFILAILWSLAILSCLISSRLKPPYSYIGPGTISTVLLITIILLSLPMEKPSGRYRQHRFYHFHHKPNDTDNKLETFWNYDHEDYHQQQHSIIKLTTKSVDWNTYLILPLFLCNSIGILVTSFVYMMKYYLF